MADSRDLFSGVLIERMSIFGLYEGFGVGGVRLGKCSGDTLVLDLGTLSWGMWLRV